MNIIFDKDAKMDYEVNGLGRRLFNFLFIPILNILPTGSSLLIRKSHKSVDEVVENATTHAALEVLYKKGHKHHSRDIMHKISHSLWFNTLNSKAVRNRLKIVKRELVILLKKISIDKKEIMVASIASGSARAVVESIVNSEISNDVKIDGTFVDKNPKALQYSQDLFKEIGINSRHQDEYRWVNTTAGSFFRDNSQSYDIVEMVGLLDYFNDEKAVSIFKDIYSNLNSGGAFITANVCPNVEQKFLTKIIKWEMIYRTAEQLCSLLILSGFKESDIVVYYEPLKVHCIAVARK